MRANYQYREHESVTLSTVARSTSRDDIFHGVRSIFAERYNMVHTETLHLTPTIGTTIVIPKFNTIPLGLRKCVYSTHLVSTSSFSLQVHYIRVTLAISGTLRAQFGAMSRAVTCIFLKALRPAVLLGHAPGLKRVHPTLIIPSCCHGSDVSTRLGACSHFTMLEAPGVPHIGSTARGAFNSDQWNGVKALLSHRLSIQHITHKVNRRPADFEQIAKILSDRQGPVKEGDA